MIRPEMTAQQAEALATYVVTLRPGQRAWTKTAVLDALAQATTRTRDVEVLTRAAVRAAITPNIATPAVIGMDGAHWEGATQRLVEHREPAKADQCPKCRDFYMPWEAASHECTRPSTRTTAYTDQLRAELATVRADQCPHGPRCADCKKARDHAETEEEKA
jgi:hypothetical protein